METYAELNKRCQQLHKSKWEVLKRPNRTEADEAEAIALSEQIVDLIYIMNQQRYPNGFPEDKKPYIPAYDADERREDSQYLRDWQYERSYDEPFPQRKR